MRKGLAGVEGGFSDCHCSESQAWVQAENPLKTYVLSFPLRREGVKESETTNENSNDSAKYQEQVAQCSLSCLKTGSSALT